ncbi:hypothetical protein EI534_14620 [Pseudomonas frederiksbergensis]|nr:hypothetical protein [Pseudomonas frederiksbergensis]
MDITKQQDKPLSLLEKAKEELAAFNRKQLSIPEAASIPNTKINTREPSHSERILYCSKVSQASAVLILKLHEKGAEITDVIARRNAPAFAQGDSQPAHNDLNMRALLLGNYQGCPHCDNSEVVLCPRCGNLSCIGSQPRMTCPACDHSARVVSSGISLEVSCEQSGQQASSQTEQHLLAKPAGRPALPYRPG